MAIIVTEQINKCEEFNIIFTMKFNFKVGSKK